MFEEGMVQKELPSCVITCGSAVQVCTVHSKAPESITLTFPNTEPSIIKKERF